MLHCPRCRSTDIFAEVGGYMGSMYHCKRCGYQGAFVVEYDEPGGGCAPPDGGDASQRPDRE